MASGSYDFVVLGGGPAGYSAALRAADLGLSAAVIEQGELGGTCLHRGCVPTKALLHAAEIADSVREADRYGIGAELTGIHNEQLAAYKNGIIDRLHTGLSGLMASRGVTAIPGYGVLEGPHSIRVDDGVVTGNTLVLATGAAPTALPHVAFGGRVLNSDMALASTVVPNSAVVIGGGVIGVEFASMWASLGAQVTIVEAQGRILPTDDEFLSKHLARAFRKRGIKCSTSTLVESVLDLTSHVRVTLNTGTVLEPEVVLVAIGRSPRTTGLGFEEAGIQLQNRFVVTDDRLRTALSNVYAIGDIVAGPQLAHRGFAQGIFVAEDAVGLAPRPIDESGIPRITYSRPEVASVGLSESSARELYGDRVNTAVYDLAGNAKSQILGTAGAVKVVAAVDGRILGVQMVGERVSELIGEAQILSGTGARYDDVARFIHAHPTQHEALGEALLALAEMPMHSHA